MEITDNCYAKLIKKGKSANSTATGKGVSVGGDRLG